MAIFDRDRDVLEVGLEAIVVGVVAFAFALGSSKELKEIAGFWPVVLVVLGGGLLLCHGYSRVAVRALSRTC